MEWLSQNWFFVLILTVFVGKHLFGHKRGHEECGKDDNDDPFVSRCVADMLHASAFFLGAMSVAQRASALMAVGPKGG